MIQRIQTLYLFLTFLMLLTLFFAPLANFVGGAELYTLTIWGFEASGASSIEPIPTRHMGILAVIATALPLVTIFLYRFRWIQLRLCIVQMVLLVGLQAYFCLYLFGMLSVVNQLEVASTSYQLTDVIPLVGLVLTWLAFRGVVRDNNLIKSLNRIR